MYHRLASVRPLDGYQLEAVFQNGEKKRYDTAPLMDKWPAFLAFRENPALFRLAHVDAGGYAVAWTDELDLESEDIWTYGVAPE